MTEPEASIVVAVDPTNPGQFFACCGLLELADRLWPGAEGWFDPKKGGREFHIAFTDKTRGTLREVIEYLVNNNPRAVLKLEPSGINVKPLVAPLALSFDGGKTEGLTLDAWVRVAIRKGIAQAEGQQPWNFWSGQQTSGGIWEGLHEALVEQMGRVNLGDTYDVLAQRLLQGGRFGFDSGPAWNALDVGFSPNEQGMEVESSPLTELLAAVGLQRFRPAMNDDRDGFDYFTWHSACSPSVAAAAMAGAMRDRRTLRYRASVTSRGQYAALGFAHLLNPGDTDE